MTFADVTAELTDACWERHGPLNEAEAAAGQLVVEGSAIAKSAATYLGSLAVSGDGKCYISTIEKLCRLGFAAGLRLGWLMRGDADSIDGLMRGVDEAEIISIQRQLHAPRLLPPPA